MCVINLTFLNGISSAIIKVQNILQWSIEKQNMHRKFKRTLMAFLIILFLSGVVYKYESLGCLIKSNNYNVKRYKK